MFKTLISKFMAKSIIAKIVIVSSTVVVVGGATTGAILIPKYIEQKQEEQRQEQIRQENEADLANISITLKTDNYKLPWNGVTQGITIDRYENLEDVMPFKLGDEIDKEKQKKVMIEMFVENYTGGELTVEVDPNMNESTRGDYNVIFTVTSEKGNTKSATGIISVLNYYRPNIIIDKADITITKGTNVDIMEGITIETNLPKEEQGEIKTEGTVDVNKVGTYTITYTYIPKEGLEGEPIVGTGTRTYRVIEKPNLKLNTKYTMEMIENIGGEIIFTSANEYKYTTLYSDGSNGGTRTGTYTIKGNRVTLKCPEDWGNETKDLIINNSNNTCYWDLDYENLN